MTWETKAFTSFSLGMKRSVPMYKLEDGYSPFIENMIVSQGTLVTDTGYTVLGTAPRGVPRLVYMFKKKDGTAELLLITDATLYKWAVGEWRYVQGNVGTLVDNVGGYAAGSTSINVDDIAGFSDGDYIGITLDNGTQHKTTINGTPSGTTIVLADGVPTGRTIPDNAPLIQAVVFNGTENLQPSAATFPAYDVVIITNGVDNVKRYDGANCIDVPNLVSAVGGTNCLAKKVLVQNNKVLLYGMTENSVVLPQRVRWCATGDYTDWTTALDAGFEDLYSDEGEIITAEKLGSYIVIYKENCRIRQEYVGTESTTIYTFTTTLTNKGIAGPNAVANLGSAHVVLTKDGMDVYEAGYTTTELGVELRSLIFENVETGLNQARRHMSYVRNVLTKGEIWFFLPMGNSDYASTLWRYNVREKAWTTRKFANNMYGVDSLDYVQITAWAEAAGTWEDWSLISWDDPSLKANKEQLFFYGLTGEGAYQVYTYDFESTSDAGVNISGVVWTPEVIQDIGKIRINRLLVSCKGTEITVEYSTDKGLTWQLFGIVTPVSTIDYYLSSIFRQVVCDRLIFRFSSNTAFGIDWMEFKYMVEGAF